VPAFKTNESRKFRDGGTISFEEMEFIDGSLLNFFEDIYIGEIKRYSYEYIQPNGFFFLYENEGIENGIRKPLHHLHVGIMKDYANGGLLDKIPEKLKDHKGPHFKAPEMNFHEFMGIIVANFFSDHRDYEYMLEHLRLEF